MEKYKSCSSHHQPDDEPQQSTTESSQSLISPVSLPRGEEVAEHPEIQRHQVGLDEHRTQGIGKNLKEHENRLGFRWNSSLNSQLRKFDVDEEMTLQTRSSIC